MIIPTTSHDTPLPHHTDRIYLTDGGLETTLVFHEGIDLPDFACFPMLHDDAGRAALERYYDAYLSVALALDAPFVIDTPTWRANLDWGTRLGYDRDALDRINRNAVVFVRRLAEDAGVSAVVNGVIGPRGDGYVVGSAMSVDEAASYHSLQARAFARAGADMITAVTMTYTNEAIGIVRAAGEADTPVVISFTVETDGRLPSGEPLGDAIECVDRETDGASAYFMVNCAHPTHFAHVLASGDEWTHRIQGIRANASKMSHAELDEAEELDRGDVAELGTDYAALHDALPNLRVVGGCCGTDHEHVAAVARAVGA